MKYFDQIFALTTEVTLFTMSSSNIPFTVHADPIDYFELTDDHFSEGGFSFSKELIDFNTSEKYLDVSRHFKTLNLYEKETTVLNIQVGKGKTQVFYDLIRVYYDQGYYVIVCSPFLKLIHKDIENIAKHFKPAATSHKFSHLIKSKVPSKPALFTGPVFYAEDLSEDDETRGGWWSKAETAPYRYSMHVMTINRLLGNSGTEGVEQNRHKRKYLKELLKATKDKKVVLFFDEIHESVHNFRSSLIPNLLKWKDRVEKVFIASATFTPSAIPAIKAISLLTDRKIRAYELPRLKNTEQARIHLHVMKDIYSSKSRIVKSLLKKLITSYNDDERAVQIVTGTKALAVEIATHCFKEKVYENEHVEVGLRHINLLTADTLTPFYKNQNNIGTTIKTGVNIEESNGVLIVIFPTINDEKNFTHYGIFKDGISSIIQATGRLRNGGDMHLIIHKPKELIDEKSKYPQLLQNVNHQSYQKANDGYRVIQKKYNKMTSRLQEEIVLMETDLKKFAMVPGLFYKNNFGFWYPNFHEFLMTQANYLVQSRTSFGKWIGPYILWAAIHDQFSNGKLYQLHYHEVSLFVPLSDDGIYAKLEAIINSKEDQIKSGGFRNSLNRLSQILESQINQYGEEIAVRYKSEKGELWTSAQLLNREPSIIRQAIKTLYRAATGDDINLDQKNDYLGTCIIEAIANPNTSSEVIDAYRKLSDIKNEHDTWLSQHLVNHKGKTFIPSEIYKQLDDNFIERAKSAFMYLIKKDPILSLKAVSLMQNLNSVDVEEQRRMVFTTLGDIQYELKRNRKQIKGVQHIEILGQPIYEPKYYLL